MYDKHPDFIVLVEPATPEMSYRLSVETFDDDEDKTRREATGGGADHCGDDGAPAVVIGDAAAGSST